MTKCRVCAVIPAAGRGTRFNYNKPKILTEVLEDKTVWDILYEKLSPIVDKIHVVLSPESFNLFEKKLANNNMPNSVSTSIQKAPIGMGDAIFGAFDFWKNYENILIIWGDQVSVSVKTLEETIDYHFLSTGRSMIIPTAYVSEPYVQYIFNNDFSELLNIKQTREGEICDERGYADVGVFCLSTSKLKDEWEEFLMTQHRGKLTGEINFLPFLTYLSKEKSWSLQNIKIDDPTETRGINTLQDLFFFRKKFKAIF